MTAVDLGHDPGAGPADLRQGLVGRIGRQQAGAKTHEAVQHMVPLLQREANAFALGGTEIAIDIDGERADAGRDGGGRRLVGIAIGGSIVITRRGAGRRPGGRERQGDAQQQKGQARNHQTRDKAQRQHRHLRYLRWLYAGRGSAIPCETRRCRSQGPFILLPRLRAGLSHMATPVVSTGARSAERRDLLSTISGLSLREGLSTRAVGRRSRRRE